MAITYNSTSNRIFLDPDGGVDTNFTLDDIVTSQPTHISKSGSTYSIDCSIIVVGTDSARAILTASNTIFHFNGGVLGNFGGELRLGELVTVDEIPRNGCVIIYEGNSSTHGTDPYNKSTDRSDTSRDYPLARTSGRVFIYNTQYKVIGGTTRNDMLDISSNANEVDLRDCIFDGNTDGGASDSYTHLLNNNTFLEDVRIINFGIFEVGSYTIKEWTGVSHTIGNMGLSVFQASQAQPVSLFGLKLQQQSTFGKRPSDSYANLTNLEYDGAYTFQSFGGHYYGIWNLLYTVDLKAVADGLLLENCRTALTDTNDIITFDILTDVNGTIPQQRVVAFTSEEEQSTFNIDNNPFYFRAWKYGKNALEIPSNIDSPLVLSATMVDNEFITLSKTQADAVSIDFEKASVTQSLTNSDFDSQSIIESQSGTATGTWYSVNTTKCGINANGELEILRQGDVDWNGGAIVYQNFNVTAGVEYTIQTKVNDMGGAGQYRFGFSSYNEYIITTTGEYQYTFTASATETLQIMVNSDPGWYSLPVLIEYFRIFDETNITPFLHNSKEYTYKCDCLNSSINNVYHKLSSIWGDVATTNDSHYPISVLEKEGLSTVDGDKYIGTKGILFENFSGKLYSMTSDDGTDYVFPASFNIVLSGINDNSEVRIYKEVDSVELGGIENSVGDFTDAFTYIGNVIIIIHHLNYKYIKIEYTFDGNDVNIPIQQQIDRYYKND